MTEIVSQLTDDEYAVLMIADQGQHMLAIGRWEKPVKNLVACGYMRKVDDVNYLITDAGRQAMQSRDKEDDAALLTVFNHGINMKNAHAQIAESLQSAALHLSHAVRATTMVTGDTPEFAAKKWALEIEKRALELLK